MLLEYSIISGYITISKKVFIKEMLYKDSKLRMLLDIKSADGLGMKHPAISESEQQDAVTIKYDSSTSVNVSESPDTIVGYLKNKYGSSIKGHIGCMVVYTTFGNVVFFNINLNSEDGSISHD